MFIKFPLQVIIEERYPFVRFNFAMFIPSPKNMKYNKLPLLAMLSVFLLLAPEVATAQQQIPENIS